MSETLETRITHSLAASVREEVAAFAKALAEDEGADAGKHGQLARERKTV